MTAFLIIVIALFIGVVLLIISLLFLQKDLASTKRKLHQIKEKQGLPVDENIQYKLEQLEKEKGQLQADRERLQQLLDEQKQVTPPSQYTHGTNERVKRKKKSPIIWIVAFAFILVAILTNPGESKHKEAVKGRVNTYMQQYLSNSFNGDDSEWDAAGKSLGLLLGGEIINKMIETVVSSDNYLLFSMTKITWAGESKTIGFGAFGHVFIPKQIDRALKEELLDNYQ